MTDLLVLAGVIAFILIVIAIVAFGILSEQRRIRSELSDLFKLLGGDYSGAGAETTLDGVPLYYGVVGRANPDPSCDGGFLLRFKAPLPFQCTIALETELDKTAKGIGFNSELQTGDPAFDQRFYLTSYHQDALKGWVSSSITRDQISRLLSSGFHRLVSDHQGVSLWAPYERFKSEKAEIIFERAKLLREVYAGMASLAQSKRMKEGPGALTLAFPYIWVTVLVLAAISIFSWSFVQYPPLDPLRVFLFSLIYSVPALLLCSYVLWQGSKKLVSGHRVFLGGAIGLLLACGLGGHGGVVLYNAFADQSSEQLHQLAVEKVEKETHSKSTSYFALVKSWRVGREIEKIEIDKSTYLALKEEPSDMLLVTRAGAFNFEWVVRYSVS